jgi:hypothetical protein
MTTIRLLTPAAPAIKAFLLREFFTLTLSGTVQRSGLYKNETTEKDRKPFQDSLRKLLVKLAGVYDIRVTEKTHVANIERLAKRLTKKHAAILAKGGMRIGHAQKALNLYLKYLLCLGEIPKPPHCPLDAIVLGQVPGCKDVRWTQIATVEKYLEIIEKAKKKANGLSLAQWELALWNSRIATTPGAGACNTIKRRDLFVCRITKVTTHA